MRRERLIPLILTVCLIAAADPSAAGVNRWTTAGPEGGTITALASDPADPGIVYAATAGGRVFRTAGAAEGEPRWEPLDLPDGPVTALGTSAELPPALYAGTESGRIFKTVDRGERWVEIDVPPTGRIHALAYDAPRRRMLAGTESRLVAIDTAVVTMLDLKTRHVVTGGDGVIYAASPAAILVSADGGSTWTRTSLPGGPLAVDAITSAVYAAQEFVVMTSGDRGSTWRALPFVHTRVASLIAIESRLYAATSHGVYVYESGNSSWQRLGSLTTRINALTVTDSSPRRIYAGTDAGVFMSAEGSGEWSAANRGLVAAFVADIDLTDGSAYAATRGGLFRSNDAGASWQKVHAVDGPVTQVATDRAEGVYVAAPQAIHASSDAGETWSVITAVAASRIAASQSPPGTIYAAAKDALLKSTDNGRVWRSVSNGLVHTYSWFYYGFSASALEMDGDNPETVYVAYDAGLFRSTTGGDSWTRLFGQEAAYNVIPAVAARGSLIHAAQKSGIITSFDGGASWSKPALTAETVQAIAIDPTDARRSYAGTASGRIYRSDDFGREWVVFGEGLGSAPVNRLAVSDNGEVIYAATAGGVYTYQIGPTVPFERLPDDPQRLPNLIRQLTTRAASAKAVAAALADARSGFILPAVGSVAGASGTFFRTDVTLSNARGTEQAVVVAWLPQGNTNGASVPMFRMTLPASGSDDGGTLTIADMSDELRLTGLGSMVVIAVDASGNVDADAEIDGFARIRAASSCAAGSVSQSLPAVGLSATRRARALGLRHESAYRTNVGIVNLGEATRQFTVVVGGQRRSERFTVTVPPFASVQSPVPQRDYGPLALTVTTEGGAAPWVAYGSSVDNASGDSWSSLAVPQRER